MITFYTDEFWGLDYPPTTQPDWLFEDLYDLSSDEKDWDDEDDEEENYWSPYEWFN
jgi:hypothetical protein